MDAPAWTSPPTSLGQRCSTATSKCTWITVSRPCCAMDSRPPRRPAGKMFCYRRHDPASGAGRGCSADGKAVETFGDASSLQFDAIYERAILTLRIPPWAEHYHKSAVEGMPPNFLVPRIC